MDRSKWPLSRNFREDVVPKSELRTKHEVKMIRTQKSVVLSMLEEKVSNLMESCNSWTRSQALLARISRASFLGRDAILIDPGPSDLAAARQLLFIVSMSATRKAKQQKKLTALCVEERKGVIVTTGRFNNKTLGKLLGKENLPVLMPSCVLARLILAHCHEEDHRRSPTDVMARSRRHTWIHRGYALAKKVVQGCMRCRLEDTKAAQQVLSQVPEGILTISPPFTATACDLFGPYITRGMGGSVRRSMKTWGVMFICLRTKSTAILACPGYDTLVGKTFLTRLRMYFWKLYT